MPMHHPSVRPTTTNSIVWRGASRGEPFGGLGSCSRHSRRERKAGEFLGEMALDAGRRTDLVLSGNQVKPTSAQASKVEA